MDYAALDLTLKPQQEIVPKEIPELIRVHFQNDKIQFDPLKTPKRIRRHFSESQHRALSDNQISAFCLQANTVGDQNAVYTKIQNKGLVIPQEVKDLNFAELARREQMPIAHDLRPGHAGTSTQSPMDIVDSPQSPSMESIHLSMPNSSSQEEFFKMPPWLEDMTDEDIKRQPWYEEGLGRD